MESQQKEQAEVEHYDHKLYKHVTEIKDADAVAFAFVNKDKVVHFPYKVPELGAKELRANVLYSGLCLSDSLHARGRWGGSMYPLAPGHEIIAEVSEVGSEVTEYKKGDKVAFGTMREICDNCKYCMQGKGEPLCIGNPNKFTYGFHWGGYSTLLQQPADFFVPVPEGLDIKRAAPLLCAGITVYNPIRKYLRPGDEAAVVGIGGLGHLAVQFLSKMGHKVTGVTTSISKKDFIHGLGATDVLDSTDPTAMFESEGKFDFLISTVPSFENFSQLLSLVAPGGTFVIVGVADAGSLTTINPAELVIGEKKIVGSLVGKRADIKEMLEFCQKHDVYPIVEEFSFEDFPKALDKLENGKPHFRCVVKADDYSKNNNLFK